MTVELQREVIRAIWLQREHPARREHGVVDLDGRTGEHAVQLLGQRHRAPRRQREPARDDRGHAHPVQRLGRAADLAADAHRVATMAGAEHDQTQRVDVRREQCLHLHRVGQHRVPTGRPVQHEALLAAVAEQVEHSGTWLSLPQRAVDRAQRGVGDDIAGWVEPQRGARHLLQRGDVLAGRHGPARRGPDEQHPAGPLRVQRATLWSRPSIAHQAVWQPTELKARGAQAQQLPRQRVQLGGRREHVDAHGPTLPDRLGDLVLIGPPPRGREEAVQAPPDLVHDVRRDVELGELMQQREHAVVPVEGDRVVFAPGRVTDQILLPAELHGVGVRRIAGAHELEREVQGGRGQAAEPGV